MNIYFDFLIEILRTCAIVGTTHDIFQWGNNNLLLSVFFSQAKS
jgi:hypothetical protein